ncbi:MAG TPA: YceI family protein [Pirellulales bacterium]
MKLQICSRIAFGLACVVVAGLAPRWGSAEEPVAPGTIDAARSRVYVRVEKSGFGHTHGIAGKLKSGTIALGAPQKAGEMIFDVAGFQADTKAAREYVGLEGETDAGTRQQVNENMLGEKVLNATQYPTASFVIDSAQPLAPEKAGGLERCKLSGKFTLRGVERPLEIIANVARRREGVHLQGAFKIKQTDYGMTPFSKGFGLVGVADELTIWGDIWLAP